MLAHLQNINDLANFLGVSTKSIRFFCFTTRGQHVSYRLITIKKRDGNNRHLSAPHQNLKYIQKQINARILDTSLCSPKKSVYSYVKGRSAMQMASRHVARNFVVRIDLESFFDTINTGRVIGMFRSFPFNANKNVASILALLCTSDNRLPQGAPTSPAISNYICRKMDQELVNYCAEHGIRYSRYSDDMVFSSKARRKLLHIVQNDPVTTLFSPSQDVRQIIDRNGFRINEDKTRVAFKHNRQMVVGHVCNKKRNVKRTYIRQIRTLINLSRKDPANALQAYRTWNPNSTSNNIVYTLKGMIEYVRAVKGYDDPVVINLAQRFNNLVCVSYNQKVDYRSISSSFNQRYFEERVFVLHAYHKNYGKSGKGFGDEAILYKTGTCFFLEGTGIVTSFHCLYHKTVLFRAFSTSFTFDVDQTKAYARNWDLAILDEDCVFPGLRKFLRAETAVRHAPGDQVYLVGFPQYKEGDSVSMKTGRITRFVERFGLEHIAVDIRIVEGDSGSPVLNEHGRVIGVARSNHDDNLVVPIGYVNRLNPDARPVRTLDYEFTQIGEPARSTRVSMMQQVKARLKQIVRYLRTVVYKNP